MILAFQTLRSATQHHLLVLQLCWPVGFLAFRTDMLQGVALRIPTWYHILQKVLGGVMAQVNWQDRFGRARVLTWTLVPYTLATACTAVSTGICSFAIFQFLAAAFITAAPCLGIWVALVIPFSCLAHGDSLQEVGSCFGIYYNRCAKNWSNLKNKGISSRTNVQIVRLAWANNELATPLALAFACTFWHDVNFSFNPWCCEA